MAKIFEVVYGEAIRSSGTRVAAVTDGARNNIRREGGYRYIKQTIPEEPAPYNLGGWVNSVGTGEVNELISKICCYFFVAGERFGGKCDGLIESVFGTFAIKGFDYAPQV